jgi:hypothetical protein
MDASIFFTNGDPSEPRLNAEGSFKNDFQGSFADEQQIGFVPSEEPKFGLTREELLDSVRTTFKGGTNDSDALLKAQLDGQNNKLSTGAWIAIGVSVVVVFGGLGYILYKKYK